MQADIRRVDTGRDGAAERFGHRPHVMRPGTATNSNIIDSHIPGLDGKIGHFKTGKQEGIQQRSSECGVSPAVAGCGVNESLRSFGLNFRVPVI